MRKKILTFLVAIVCAFPTGSFAASTQVDSLIEKLVDKGILDKKEARELKMEIAQDTKAIQEESLKSGLPEWVQNTKLKGDARVRYQYERRENDTEARTRGRARFRLGLESQINPQWKVGAGLATAEVGSTTDDARSTNMTFNDNFRRGDIRLDYMFAEYKPFTWGKGVIGKYIKTDYLWTTSDMIWDTDLNPAGTAINLTHKFNDNVSVFGNTGAWVLDENGKTDRTDPYMIYGQAGTKLKEGDFDASLAGVYYGFHGVKGILMDGTASTNTLSGGVLKHDYDSVGAAFELGMNNPTAGMLPVPRVALFGDSIYNLDTDDDYMADLANTKVDDGFGWAAGIKFGDEKVVGRGQWQFKYQYTDLGKDAFPDAFPDSDRLGGATNVKGNEFILEYGLAKNVTLAFDYYMDDVREGAKNKQHLAQADLNIKF